MNDSTVYSPQCGGSLYVLNSLQIFNGVASRGQGQDGVESAPSAAAETLPILDSMLPSAGS